MSTSAATTARCPLCGQENSCVMAAGKADASTCWCREFPFDAAVRQRARAKPGCICAACGAAGRLVSEVKTGA